MRFWGAQPQEQLASGERLLELRARVYDLEAQVWATQPAGMGVGEGVGTGVGVGVGVCACPFALPQPEKGSRTHPHARLLFHKVFVMGTQCATRSGRPASAWCGGAVCSTQAELPDQALGWYSSDATGLLQRPKAGLLTRCLHAACALCLPLLPARQAEEWEPFLHLHARRVTRAVCCVPSPNAGQSLALTEHCVHLAGAAPDERHL